MLTQAATPLVSGFTVGRRIGKGASGTVYLAREDRGGRAVALKLFPEECAKAFLREIEALRAVDELRARAPQLRVVGSVGAGPVGDAGGSYIAFEYVENGTLADLVRGSGPVEARRAARMIAEAAETVAVLHEAGLYHRDLKPQNLLLGADGHVHVCDFGIARPLGATTTADGSPAFAAPEIIGGRRDPDGRCVDVYGLGATLYFLLVGAPMAPGRPDVFALERRAVPRDIQRVVIGATATRPEDRTANAGQLASQLIAAPKDVEKPGDERTTSPPRAASGRERRMSARLLRVAAFPGVALCSIAVVMMAKSSDRLPAPLAPPPAPPPAVAADAPPVADERPGPAGKIVSPTDGAEMLYVPSGSVAIGDPPQLVSTPAFYVDRRPVSVRQFTRFLSSPDRDHAIERALDAGRAREWLETARAQRTNFMFPATGADEVEIATLDALVTLVRDGPCHRGPADPTPPAPTDETEPASAEPVAGVSWFDATAFAIWAGKRLPTEAERRRARDVLGERLVTEPDQAEWCADAPAQEEASKRILYLDADSGGGSAAEPVLRGRTGVRCVRSE